MGSPVVERGTVRPLHLQLSDRMLQLIQDGTWPVNHKLPIEPELARQFGVSRGTLRRAVATLVESGHLARVHGRGTFVLPPDFEQPLAQELIGIGDAFDRQGIANATGVISLTRVPAPQHVSHVLQLDGDEVFRLERLRSVAGTPVALLRNYVDPYRIPRLEAHDFSRRRLFAVIQDELGTPLQAARRTFSATLAGRDLAQTLGTGRGAPILYLEQVTYIAGNIPVECSEVWFRGDMMKVTAYLQHPAGLGSESR